MTQKRVKKGVKKRVKKWLEKNLDAILGGEVSELEEEDGEVVDEEEGVDQ